MASIVYWIHLEEHTDMFTQGYIGVTNNLNVRLRNHKSKKTNKHLVNAMNKYGWDNIIKEVILVADEAYCLMIEKLLRVKANIGWNIVEGGGKPPVTRWNKGRKIPQEKLDNMKTKGFGFKKGHKAWNTGIKLNEEQLKKQFSLAEFVKEHGAWNKGNPMLPHVKEMLIKSLTGKTQSEKSKLKKSLANKGRVFEKITCSHCNKIGGLTGMKRWHMDNCKLKGKI